MNTPLPRRRIVDDATSGLGSTRGPHLSIRGGRFRLIAATEVLLDTHYVDIIIVDANRNSARVYFEGDFADNTDEPPACFSDNGTGPSTQSMSPQSTTCAICPHNVRGSDQTFTGKATTACSNRKKLAFILPDDQSCTVYEFQIPPASLTGLRTYGDWVGAQMCPHRNAPADFADFVTRVSFDPARQFVLAFQAVSWADDERTLQMLEYIVQNNLSDAAVGRNDVAHDPAFVAQMIAARRQASAGALGSNPPSPALQSGQQQQLPPRQAAPAPQPLPAGAPAAPRAPQAPRRGRGPAKAQAQLPPASPSPAAPFMAPAAAQPVAFPSTPAATAPIAHAPPAQAVSSTDGIPAFLQRSADNTPPAPTPPRFGIGTPPAPPAAIGEALAQAMNLPTRRG